MIVDYLPLKRDTQITIFDYERAVVLDVANRVANWFNRRYQFDFWTSTDVESEAQLIALEYYQKDDYNVSRLRSTIRFELSTTPKVSIKTSNASGAAFLHCKRLRRNSNRTPRSQ